MSWYYTREAGAEGQVLTDEGTPPGLTVSALLERGPVPMAVCLEVVAFLADILTIAEDDNALHGDIKPGDVCIDFHGSVSLSGFGLARRTGRAPDSPLQLPASDVYGLGVVLHAMLSSTPMGAIPRERDAHDDAIVDRLLAIDWTEMEGIPGRDPVIHFLCSMLAHSPAERPAPLDVANIVSGVAAKMGSPSLVEWAQSSIAAAPASTDVPAIDEVLAEPEQMGKVFTKTGQYSRRQTASSKGECTAFWSRDKIAAMLDDGEDQLSASAMFDRRDLAGRLNHSGAPRKPPQPSPSTPYPEEAPWAPDATLTGKNASPQLNAAIAELKAGGAREPVTLPPQPPGPLAPPSAEPTSPVPPPVRASRVSPAPQREPGQTPFPWVPVVIGVVGMGTVLGLFAVAGVAYWYLQDRRDGPPPAVESAAAPADQSDAPKAEERTPVRSERAAPTPAKTPRVKRAKRRRAPASDSEIPASVTGEFEVAFRTAGASATLRCGDGQQGQFAGMIRRTFTVPTTCRVDIGDAKGAVQVSTGGTVTCTATADTVTCTGP